MIIKEQELKQKNVFLLSLFLFHLDRLILVLNLSWYQILAWPLIGRLKQILQIFWNSAFNQKWQELSCRFLWVEDVMFHNI